MALVGTEGGTKTGKARKFWGEIADEYDLRTFIHPPKNAFYKYGTTVETTVVCVVKKNLSASENRRGVRKNILETSCETLEDCLKYVNVFD